MLLLARCYVTHDMGSNLFNNLFFVVRGLRQADCRWRDWRLSAGYRVSAVIPGTGADGTIIWGSRGKDVPPLALHPLP